MSRLVASALPKNRLFQNSLLPRASFRFKSTKFGEYTPSPPKLPKEQQEEFEKLQKLANSQAAIDDYNRQIEENGFHSSEISTQTSTENIGTDVGATSQYFKTIPEFEGDRNPVTGEVGGPKQEPLRHNDWSYNGRVTDF